MPRPFKPQVVTANDLLDGDPIWLTEADHWSRDVTEAELIEDEAHAQIRLLFAESQPDRIVGAYLTEAEATPSGPAVTHIRERIRASGPTTPYGA